MRLTIAVLVCIALAGCTQQKIPGKAFLVQQEQTLDLLDAKTGAPATVRFVPGSHIYLEVETDEGSQVEDVWSPPRKKIVL